MNILLVVDLQKDFKNKADKYNKLLEFIEQNRSLYDEVWATVCICTPKSPFSQYKVWSSTTSASDPLDFKYDKLIVKHGYGLDDYRELPKSYTYDIMGCETDACILKIAMDLFDKNYKFRVLTDYCYTLEDDKVHNFAVKQLKHLMNKAII